MALTFSSFDTFDEVVAHYNNTTPLRGKDNVGKDIRPIGDRKRKHERIAKISENCYALSDGYHFGDEHFYYFNYGAANYKPSLAYMEQYAPIVWRKKRDGTEEVTLRNGYGFGAHNSRYQFLYRHTPKGMWFRNRNGKHFIEVGTTRSADTVWRMASSYTEYYLAKVRTAPKAIYTAIKSTAGVHHWSKQNAAWVMAHDDNSAVVFRKDAHGSWLHVSGTGQDISNAKGPTVKKAEKAKYKDAIKSFFEWGMAMSPLLPLEDDDYRRARSADIANHFDNRYNWSNTPLEKMKSRAIVCADEHPLRVSLWVEFATSHSCTDKGWSFAERSFAVKTVETKEDLARVRTLYNRWINRNLGFVTKGIGSK